MLFLMLTSVAYSQNNATSEKMLVDKNDLPKEVWDKLQEKNKKQELKEDIKGWAGVGKEVGEAVNGALSAVVVQAENFGKTDVGHFTMFLVAWKLFAKDMLKYLIGVSLLIVMIPLFVWSYKKRVLGHRYLVKKTPTSFFKTQKEYNFIEGESREKGAEAIAHIAFAALATLLICLMMFLP